jgi:hypothetical protein
VTSRIRLLIAAGALVAAGTALTPTPLVPVGGPLMARTHAQAADQGVPRDLKPLLAAPESEFRLVVQRYTLDRSTLNGNYFGAVGGRGGGRGGRGGGGRGGGAAETDATAPSPVAELLSPARIARLKRFDLEWQTALDRLPATSLSPAATTDLAALKATIAANLKTLDADAAARARVLPLLPFAQPIIDLYEARVRMADMDAKAAAGTVTAVTKTIGDMRARLLAGLEGGGAANAIRVSRDLAIEAADATANLRAHLTAWFGHYDGYDPLFMWWVDLPYKHADSALEQYATLLRDQVAAANQTTAGLPAAASAAIAPADAPPLGSVPDLAAIIALPQDEMRDIVNRFRGVGAGGRGGGRGRGGDGPARDTQFYRDWLAALNSLDFASLSRNAQVDYLFIKRTSELYISRANARPQQNIPRKTDNSGITGAARGRDGLILDLADELIPYTPEQLIELGNREYIYTVEEMKKASREMGFGDDWKKAVERVKEMHVEPGRQPEMVRDLLYEAVDYLRTHDLITVPQVASESLRMRMLSPQEQLTAPFFLGGSMILVAYPTNTMEYDTRIQAMRGNNRFFSNAVAHHEMIPGHNLVGFMGSRFNGYRPSLGGTPFLGEGWPLYWETILYDKGFHDTPEKKVGALFWRMHRAARIVFSMNFHMGIWSPQDCIDFLVNEVGHERDNATAEVRRSFAGNYGPLYQMAYLVGGLQIRGIRKELVDSGVMTEKAFHDEIMRQGSMPIAYLRLALLPGTLTKDTPVDWPFYGPLTGAR